MRVRTRRGEAVPCTLYTAQTVGVQVCVLFKYKIVCASALTTRNSWQFVPHSVYSVLSLCVCIPYFHRLIRARFTLLLLPDVFIESFRFVPFWENSNVSMSHMHARSRDKELRILIFFSLSSLCILLLLFRCWSSSSSLLCCCTVHTATHTQWWCSLLVRRHKHTHTRNCNGTTFGSFAIDCAASRIYLIFVLHIGGLEPSNNRAIEWSGERHIQQRIMVTNGRWSALCSAVSRIIF